MNTDSKETRVFQKRTSSWKYISVISVVLIYGTSLLLSQINALYFNYQQAHHHTSPPGNEQEVTSETPNLKIDFQSNRRPLTFQAVRNGTFYPESKDIQWIQTPTSFTDDSGEYIVVENGNYYLKSLKNNTISTLLYGLGSKIEYGGKVYEVESVTFSNNLKVAVLTCNKIHNWRHSYFAAYFIFDVETTEIQPVISSEEAADNNRIALCLISPDSEKISYVYENNVYVKNISKFDASTTKQITFDGDAHIFNGKPDWVYEEEVFESDSALWWSPDSSHLLLLRSNDTEVPTFPIPYFVQDAPGNSSSYPLVENIKYPKAGFPNPIVDILIYDIANDSLKQLPEDDPFYNDNDIGNTDRLITEVTWVGNEQVLLRVTNRESDILKIFTVSCPAEKVEMASMVSRFEDGRNDKSWFEISHNTRFIPKSDKREFDGYIDLIDVDGYDHLAYFSPANSSEPKVYLTSGEWEVVDGAAAYDFVTDKVYFISTEKSSIERHVYSIDLNGENKQNITDISDAAWYDVSFSKGARYLLLSNRGPAVPYQKLIDLHENKSEEFSNNNELAKVLERYDIPLTTFGNVTLENGVVVNYKETLPLNFDPNKKYPLLFFVYGGPGSQLVQQAFSVSFSSVIAAELDAVVVTVDGRGTGFKGKSFRNIVRDQLGHYEVADQVAAAKYWISLGYIDAERTAIWGWSYGGYMTLKTLEYDQGETFKFGMSVAPVTDWKLYDSVYTERYMHTPQGNFEGYNKSRVADVSGFKGVKRFLLMHGTGDDNVHFQNSIQFIDLLDMAGVENYDMFVFPDSDHSIRWHNAGTIVYDRLFTWLERAFSGEFENLYNFERLNGLTNNYGNLFIDLYG